MVLAVKRFQPVGMDSEQVHQLALQAESTPLSVSSWHSDVPTHATLMQKKALCCLRVDRAT